MRKILNVIGSLAIGGAEINAVNILKNIERTKYQYDYLVFDDSPGDYESVVKHLGAGVIKLPHPTKGYRQFLKIFDELLKEKNYDAIHVNTLWNSGLLLRVAKQNNIPIRIDHSHSTESSANENLTYKLYKRVMRQLIRHNATDYIACGIDAGNYLYGEDFFQNKGQVIYNGVNLASFKFDAQKRQAIRDDLNIADNELILGHVGRIAPVKNHPFMLEILKELVKKHNNVRMIFVGDGPDFKLIQDMIIEYGLESKCILLGKRNDIDYLMQAFDILLFPSFFEGFPLTLIEAQTSGLPCLISDRVTDQAVVIKESKRLPLDQMDKWVTSIEELKDNPIRRDLVEIEKIKEEFDNKQQAKKWEAIYDKEVQNCE